MLVKLGKVIRQRKQFITIDDSIEYKRCRVQVNRKGVVLRDIVKGIEINTKKQQLCKEGDFLVAEIDAKVGGYGFVPKNLEGAIVSSHYFLFEVDETRLLKSYLEWLIKTDIIQDQIASKGSTNYAAIRPQHVLNFEIPLPSIKEQEFIVNRLNNFNDEYFLLNKELNQQQTYVQLLRQTILQEAVQGKLTEQDPTDEPATVLLQCIKAEKAKLIKEGKLKKEKALPPLTKDEIPFELPGGWVWCRLGEIAQKITDGEHATPKRTDAGFYLLSARNITNEGILLNDVDFVDESEFKRIRKRCDPNKEDILISCSGSVGRVTIVDEDEKYVMVRSAAMVRKNNRLILSQYLMFALQAPFAQLQIIGRSKSSAQSNLFLGSINLLNFPLPPLAEQQRIVAKVQQLQQQLSGLEVQVQQSRQYAQQLLQIVLKETFNKTKVSAEV